MNKLVFGGAALAALIAGTAAPAGTSAKPPRARPNYFATNELRADVPEHVEKMFTRFDVNHDGFISKDEVAAAQAQFEARAAKSAPKRASRLFEEPLSAPETRSAPDLAATLSAQNAMEQWRRQRL